MRDKLINALRSGVVNIKFIKKNGETRIMNCTLNFDLISSDKLPKNKEIVNENKSNISVFETDIKEWRSFIFDNVIEWNIV